MVQLEYLDYNLSILLFKSTSNFVTRDWYQVHILVPVSNYINAYQKNLEIGGQLNGKQKGKGQGG